MISFTQNNVPLTVVFPVMLWKLSTGDEGKERGGERDIHLTEAGSCAAALTEQLRRLHSTYKSCMNWNTMFGIQVRAELFDWIYEKHGRS